MLTYRLQNDKKMKMEKKKKEKQNVDLIREDKTFTTSVYCKLALVEFIRILPDIYHLPSTIYHLSLVLYTHSLTEYTQVGVRGCSYGGELTRLGGLVRLGEISPSLKNSYKKMCSYEK